MAKQHQISREEQDAYAVKSQQRADEACKSNKFLSEIVAITVKERKGDIVVDRDEFPKPDTTLSALAKLRPAFATVIKSV